jgi:hypothetical protein
METADIESAIPEHPEQLEKFAHYPASWSAYLAGTSLPAFFCCRKYTPSMHALPSKPIFPTHNPS